MKSPFNIPSKSLKRLTCCVFGSIIGFTAPLSAATYTFDQNGSAAGFNLHAGVEYSWSTSDSVWNAAGETGTVSNWNNASNDHAIFHLESAPSGGSGNLLVSVKENLSIGAITVRQNNNNWGSVLLSATSNRDLTLASGAVITVAGNTQVKGLIFGDNVNPLGDFTVRNTGVSGGVVQLTGTGAAYNGTITIESTAADTTIGGFLIVGSDSRITKSAKFILNSGALTVTGTGTIGELSGTGGKIRAGTGVGTLIVDQAANTEWAGVFSFGSNPLSLTKKDVGRLSLTYSGTHSMRNLLKVEQGSLYVAGTMLRDGQSNDIDLSGGATFGGTVTTDKRLELLAANSILSPGMHGKAGKMTLSGGLLATNGGTFNFNMNGVDDNEDLLNSQIVLTGTSVVTLSGAKTANFFNLGESSIEYGVAYTLLDLTGVTNLTAGWDLNWTVNTVPTGWEVAAFGANGNLLQVTFIPEPSVFLLVGSGLLAGAVLRRRQRGTRG